MHFHYCSILLICIYTFCFCILTIKQLHNLGEKACLLLYCFKNKSCLIVSAPTHAIMLLYPTPFFLEVVSKGISTQF